MFTSNYIYLINWSESSRYSYMIKVICWKELILGEQVIPGEEVIPGEQVIPGEEVIPGEQVITREEVIPGEQVIPRERGAGYPWGTGYLRESGYPWKAGYPEEQVIPGNQVIPGEKVITCWITSYSTPYIASRDYTRSIMASSLYVHRYSLIQEPLARSLCSHQSMNNLILQHYLGA